MQTRVLITLLSFLLGAAVQSIAAPRAPKSPPPLNITLPTWFCGGDVSYLAREQQLGAVYKDGGKPRDPLLIFKSRGWNMMRLRVWVNPSNKGAEINDLPYTIALGKRIKQAGFKLLLDFHYSDTWADPGHQAKPAAWKDLSFAALTRQIETYSRDTITAMRRGGAMPDMVQVGNETTNGMLWPDGHVENPGGWARYGQLTQAAIRGIQTGAAPSPSPRIMVHISNGAQAGLPQWFFSNLHTAAPDVKFDVIGLSYYPDGDSTLADLQSNMAFLARTYHKPILIAETGFPHDGTPRPDQAVYIRYGLTPLGQARYLQDLVTTVRATPGGLGRGVLYWEPDWIGVDGLPQFYGSNPLFDNRFNALPGIGALTLVPLPLSHPLL